MSTWLLRAFLCGAIPLAVGIGIYSVWLFTEAPALEPAGVFTIEIGTLAFLAGLVCLAIYVRQSRARGLPVGLLPWLAFGILLANFPAAAIIIASVDDIKFGFHIEVVNESPEMLRSVQVVGAGNDLTFDAVPPGARVKRRYDIKETSHGGDSAEPLQVSGLIGRQPIQTVISGYYCSGMAMNMTVTIHPDRSVVVNPSPRRD